LALPEEASPPVSDTLNPILIASVACAATVHQNAVAAASAILDLDNQSAKRLPLIISSRQPAEFSEQPLGLSMTQASFARLAKMICGQLPNG
jgi:hypothetical protein